MSEENKWGTGLPDDDENVSAEQKPLTHPYSEGRRMQESGQNSDADAGQRKVFRRRKRNTDIMRCISLRPVIMLMEIYRPKSRGKRGIFQEATALERKQPLRWHWL